MSKSRYVRERMIRKTTYSQCTFLFQQSFTMSLRFDARCLEAESSLKIESEFDVWRHNSPKHVAFFVIKSRIDAEST
jgi:hypothetical protein